MIELYIGNSQKIIRSYIAQYSNYNKIQREIIKINYSFELYIIEEFDNL